MYLGNRESSNLRNRESVTLNPFRRVKHWVLWMAPAQSVGVDCGCCAAN